MGVFLQGIVNDQFSQIQTLKSKEEPDCAVRLINMYFIDVETILSKLTSYRYGGTPVSKTN